MTARLTPRNVAGIRAAASAASPAVTPGTIRNGTPAAASAAASSPPRANTKGSPPLSRSTRSPALRQRHQTPRNVVLHRRRPAAALAGKFEPRARVRERQHTRVDQGVVDDHIGLGEAGQRVEGQQPGIARPGAGKPDMAGFQHGNAAASRRKVRPADHCKAPAWLFPFSPKPGRTRGEVRAAAIRTRRSATLQGSAARLEAPTLAR